MVHAKSTMSLLLLKLLAVTAKNKLKINCKNSKCDFGEPIQVSFSVDNDENSPFGDRIGIYAAKEKEMCSDYTELWTYTCGFQWEYRPFRCPNLKTGTVTFDGIDPAEDGHNQQWPLSPGKYKVCHLNSDDEVLQKCKKFEVTLSKDIKKKIKKKAMIELTKEVYNYGEDIVADFDAGVAFPNTKVSVMKHPNYGYAQNYANWVYTGCNNRAGDQRWSYYLTNDCLKTQKSGKVMFTAENSFNEWTSEVLEAGEYEMRILYNNDWYQGSGSSTTKEIIEGPLATFIVNPESKSSKSPSSKSPSSKSPSLE